MLARGCGENMDADARSARLLSTARGRIISLADAIFKAPRRPRGVLAAPFAALVAGAFAMGASPIFVRLADVGPFTSAFWRVALALPVLYAWTRAGDAARRGRPSVSPRRDPRGLAFAGDLFFWHLSIVTTSVANATFFATTAPIWVVLFGWLLFGERVRPACSSGSPSASPAARRCSPRACELKTAGALGDLFGVATGVFFGLYFLAVKAARETSSAARLTFEATVITAAMLFVVALVAERSMLPHTLRGARRALRHGLDQPRRRAGAACRSRSGGCRRPFLRWSSSSRRSPRRASPGSSSASR